MSEVLLGGVKFAVAKRSDGSPRIAVGSRPSQAADAGALQYAEWRVDGPDLTGFEVIPPGGTAGYLGRSYGVNTDGRWLGSDGLGPKINTLDLDDYDLGLGLGKPGPAGADDGIPEDSGTLLGSTFLLGPMESVEDAGGGQGSGGGMALMQANGTTYGYVTRGSRPAKVDLSDMTLKNAGVVLDAPAQAIIATTPEDPTVRAEVSIGVGPQLPYTVLQGGDVGVPPVPDVWRNNLDGQPAQAFGIAPDRAVALSENVATGNIMTGVGDNATTMYDPAWNEVTDDLPFGVTPTGFAMDGNQWVIMTSDGPYMLDASTGKFFPILPELDNDDENGRQASTWSFLGTIIPLRFSIRYQKYGSGQSFGPEMFTANTSPVQGQPTGVAGSPRELFTTTYNPSTGDTYLIAWVPREASPFGGLVSSILVPHVIAKFTGKQSRFLSWIGTVNSLRTMPTLCGGYGSDLFWLSAGRTARWIDDSSYEVASSGTTYLTQLRRQPGLVKDIEFIEFETDGTLSATQTVRVGISLDGGSVVYFPAVTATGHHRQYAASAGVPLSTMQGGRAIGPIIEYATDDPLAYPLVLGTLRVHYRPRPTMIRVLTYTLELDGSATHTGNGQEEALRGFLGNGSKEFQDLEQETYYARVTDVSAIQYEEVGSGRDSNRGLRRTVNVTVESWPTS